MTNREAIMTLQAHVVFACEKAGLSKAVVKAVEDALDMAISALEKQAANKCCETCKYEDLELETYPCCDCIRAKDHYEPYTEEEL